jgi:hypothetical protein
MAYSAGNGTVISVKWGEISYSGRIKYLIYDKMAVARSDFLRYNFSLNAATTQINL